MQHRSGSGMCTLSGAVEGATDLLAMGTACTGVYGYVPGYVHGYVHVSYSVYVSKRPESTFNTVIHRYTPFLHTVYTVFTPFSLFYVRCHLFTRGVTFTCGA